MRLDDWVTAKGEVGVISSISPNGEVTIRIPRIDWPFPKYITVPRREAKKLEHKYEEALL
jgi:hypothetical protein